MLCSDILEPKWIFLFSIIKDTAGKYRELAAKKCHHVPKPTVELHRSCSLVPCPVRATPPVYQWSTHHRLIFTPQPEWHSSPWSQVHLFVTCELCSSIVKEKQRRLCFANWSHCDKPRGHLMGDVQWSSLCFISSAVYSDMWRRSASQDGPVSISGETLSWLCTPS